MNSTLATTTLQRRNGSFAEGAGAVGHYQGEGKPGPAQFRVDGAHALEDEITSGTKELGEAKAAKAESETANAAAEGDLAVTAKALAADTAALADQHKDRFKQGGAFFPDA